MTDDQIITALREVRDNYALRVASQAANRLTNRNQQLATITALLPDCPRCGGTGEVTGPGMHDEPCPDCDHGKVTVARLMERLAAVNAALDQYDGRNADDVRWAIAKAVGR